jgi:hypothetical protein
MARDLSQIVDELCKHPIALSFIKPMAESAYVEADYLRVIPSPMDISRIRSQIDAGNYSLAKLEKDIKLIASNTVHYFGPDTEFSNSASFLVTLFQKIVKQTKTSCDHWGKDAIRLRKSIGSMLSNRPVIVPGGTSDIDFRAPIRPQLLTNADFRNFTAASAQLQGPEDVAQMISIIERHEPNFLRKSQKITVDLAQLRLSTAKALIAHAKRVFEERHLEYPVHQT